MSRRSVLLAVAAIAALLAALPTRAGDPPAETPDQIIEHLTARAVADSAHEYLTREELAAYFEEESSLLTKLRKGCAAADFAHVARERARGIFSLCWQVRRDPLTREPVAASVDNVSVLLSRLAGNVTFERGCEILPTPGETAPTLAKTPFWSWDKLTIKRSLGDDFNPRKEDAPSVPSILSFTYDPTNADHPRQLLFIGGVGYAAKTWNTGKDSANTYAVRIGTDADMEPLKAASESSLSAALSLSAIWRVSSAETALLQYLTLGATPKFTTDRAFDREVWEAGVILLPTSPRLKIGSIIHLNVLGIGASYQPTFGLEWSHVLDAAGNTNLAAIAETGAALRGTGAINLTLTPERWGTWATRLRATGTYTWRYDFGEYWSRGLLDASLMYDLNDDGNVALTIAYRRGRKPPDFTKKDQLLFGIGLKK